MNKKILTGFLFSLSLFVVLTTNVLGIDVRLHDPKNDVIVVPNFQYTFDLSKASIEDLVIIEDINYYHTSEKEGLDLLEIDIDKNGDETVISFKILKKIDSYPYTHRNSFFCGIVIVYNNDVLGAIHMEQDFYELNIYAKFRNDVLSDIHDFIYSQNEDGVLFTIPSDVFPVDYDQIYGVVGEADLRNIDVDNVKFTINNIRIDLYPNSLYGADNSDYPENKDLHDSSKLDFNLDNPYVIGLLGALGLIGLIVIPSALRKSSG